MNHSPSNPSQICKLEEPYSVEEFNSEICSVSKSIESNQHVYNSSFGDIKVVNCSNSHIGPKIIAQNVNVVNTKSNNCFEGRLTKKLVTVFSVTCGLFITVIVIWILRNKKETEDIWFVDRSTWGAQEPHSCEALSPYSYYILIDQTDGEYCTTLEQCSLYMRALQKQHMSYPSNTKGEKFLQDINYNFVIGGDGRIYEGRSWKCECQNKAETNTYLTYTIHLGFMGDYFSDGKNHTLSQKQIQSFKDIIDIGVNHTFISIYNTAIPECCYNSLRSPGDNIFKFLVANNLMDSLCITDQKCKTITKLYTNMTN